MAKEFPTQAQVVVIGGGAVGPNVKFWQSNVAFKLPGGRGFPWHQDFAFIGASNLSPMMTFTFLEEVTPELGPTKVIPGSHLDVPYAHYDEDGNWLGVIAPHELSRVAAEKAVEICAPAGAILIAKCAVVHMAERNRGSQARPVVINGYMSADTYCYVESPYQSHYNWRIVRGETPTIVDGDGPYTKLPPDWVTYEGVRIDNMEHAY